MKNQTIPLNITDLGAAYRGATTLLVKACTYRLSLDFRAHVAGGLGVWGGGKRLLIFEDSLVSRVCPRCPQNYLILCSLVDVSAQRSIATHHSLLGLIIHL